MDVRDVAAAYRLEDVLSASPLSTVRRAVDPGSGQIVAVKLLKPLGAAVSQRQRERFEKVMRQLAELQLAAMPDVLDFGFTEEDGAFLVTSFVDGTPLSQLVGAPLERVVPILADLARALEVLAEAGLAHHNLCPENVLVVESPGGETVQLLGLGTVAYLAADGGEAPLGRSPEAERFAAAELLAPRGVAASLAWRADLYSFALLACELLRAEITGLGSPSPRVRLPATELRYGAALQEQLSVALRREPEARTTTFAELRRLLLSRLAPDRSSAASQAAPGEEEGVVVEETVRQETPVPQPPGRPQIKVKVGKRDLPGSEGAAANLQPAATAGVALPAPPAAAFDPNKTDPMLVVPEIPPVAPGQVAHPPAEAVEVLGSDSGGNVVPPAAVQEAPPPQATGPGEAVTADRSAPAGDRGGEAGRPSPPPVIPRPAAALRPRARWKVAGLIAGGLAGVAGAVVLATILLDPGPVPLIVVPTPCLLYTSPSPRDS